MLGLFVSARERSPEHFVLWETGTLKLKPRELVVWGHCSTAVRQAKTVASSRADGHTCRFDFYRLTNFFHRFWA